MGITSRSLLDTGSENEILLEILSYSGGENTVSEDHVMLANEARIVENWDAISVGGMQRAKGFNQVVTTDGATASDLAHFHFEDTTGAGEFLGLFAGALKKKSGSGVVTLTASGFTSGVLSHAAEGEDDSWITNSTDNLKRYTISEGLITPAGQPANARERVYRHKNRLIAEGGGVRIYGSRVGVGNWVNTSVGAVAFTGSGLDDATSGGTYTKNASATYEIEIDATGTPDTFKWKKNSGSYTTGVSVTGSAQTLSDGVTITFAATTGHTLADKWLITIEGDAWTASDDAWSLDAPNKTKGAVPAFPSGDTIAIFDKFRAYILSNFPNVRLDPIPNSRGCVAPYSIAVGDEGVYFLSDYPTLGVFLWDGVNFTLLTAANEDQFVDKMDLSKRIFGTYRQRKYYISYNETNSGVTYPNTLRVFNAEFGRWMERPVNDDVADNFGYPGLLGKQSNELYFWSSRKQLAYELETTDNSDDGNETEANYKTKDFTSRDFAGMATSKSVPIDDALMKLTKVTMTFYGTVGVVTILWTADRGRVTGSKTFDLAAGGATVNNTFTVNSSDIIGADSIGDKTVTKSLPNNAIGRTFNFQVLTSGTSTRPKVKKIKIHGILLTDD